MIDDDEASEECSDTEVKVSPAVSVEVRQYEIKPSDFYFGQTLGEGAFARVVHAKSKTSSAEFAIKIMEKTHIRKEDKVFADCNEVSLLFPPSYL
jgi:hypothetical protein